MDNEKLKKEIVYILSENRQFVTSDGATKFGQILNCNAVANRVLKLIEKEDRGKPKAGLENALDKAVALLVDDTAGGFWCPQSLKYPGKYSNTLEDTGQYYQDDTWLYPECKECCGNIGTAEAVVTACYKRWFMSKESDES